MRARPGGGIYAAGYSDGADTGHDGLLLAYTAAGKRLHATVDPGPDASLSSSQVFNDLVVLASGDVVCGGSDYPDTVDRYYAVFRSSGSVGSRTSEAGAFNEQIWKMAKDAQGNVYMTGPAGTETGTQILTRRLHAGSIDWESAWPDVPALDAEPAAIAINGLSVFVLGTYGRQVVLGYVN